jgi:beta-glucosidase-like glycosyl hydrolase
MPEQIAATNYFQQQRKYPLLIAQDLEPGLQRLEDLPHYPKARTLGDRNDLEFTYSVGKQIGEQARSIGVHIVFAPVVDVQTCKENPVIHSRSFGADPQRVADHGAALMHGLQDGGVVACAKHFPGHGDTTADSHQALPTLNHALKRLEEVEFIPFKRVIDEGVDAVMLGHLMLPKIDAEYPSSLSSVFIQQLLKNRLRFNGLIFTDALIMKALSNYDQKDEAALRSLMVGATVAVFPRNVEKSFEVIKEAVLKGAFSLGQLDSKVLLILKVKEHFLL